MWFEVFREIDSDSKGFSDYRNKASVIIMGTTSITLFESVRKNAPENIYRRIFCIYAENFTSHAFWVELKFFEKLAV